jgi:hypothetical protein
MKSKSLTVFARILLLSSGFWLGACRENSSQTDSVDSEAETTAAQQEVPPAQGQKPEVEVKEESSTEVSPVPDERIAELRRKIESRQEDIENIEAFAQMERSKLEEDPDYDPSFLEEALEEQREIQKSIESGEKSLKELTQPNE